MSYLFPHPISFPKMQLSYLLPFVFALPARSLFILVPLYLYPGTSASAWSNVTDAIAANPKVNWQVIINPNSGPGTYPPDANYIAGVSKINSYPNALTLGYVATDYTRIPYASLTSQIDTYAKWSTYTNSNISISGIFFDEVNNTAASTVYTYYQRAAEHAYAEVPSAITPVVLNPGAPAPAEMFDYADTIVQYENSLENYKDGTTINTFTPGYNGQTAVIVHTTTNTETVNSLVHTMAQRGVEAVHFGVDCCYNTFSASLLSLVASAVLAG